jgi:polygalacturonase
MGIALLMYLWALVGEIDDYIIPAPTATHIVAIKADTIIIASSSTYRFTVDSPEDQGLVSTRLNVTELLAQLQSRDGKPLKCGIKGKENGFIETGDRLIVSAANGRFNKTFYLKVIQSALSGQLVLSKPAITVNTDNNLSLHYTTGQRSPNVTVKIFIPEGITVTLDNTTVNVIGRGVVKLSELAKQSVGRIGSRYSYKKVGEVAIQKTADGTILVFSQLDLRPANGADLVITIGHVQLAKTGNYVFKAMYTTAAPEVLTSAGTGSETAMLKVIALIADLERMALTGLQYKETADTYTSVQLTWSAIANTPAIQLKTWQTTRAAIDHKNASVVVAGLAPDKLYNFRLAVASGPHKGFSNRVQFYSGKMDVKQFGIHGLDSEDYTDKINNAILYMNHLGGGTLYFSEGVYSVRTIHLQSNVYLYLAKSATIQALKGTDAPEATWFSDKKYRSGLSPTDSGPYADPENYLTKQDVGHHYFHNSMFFGERLDNVKIIGNGYITGNGNLVTGDRVMNNAADNRGDKMFTFKLCTNIEIGGIERKDDLWYDEARDEPYYINDSSRNTGNMLNIDRSGHFALLATGTDSIYVHDTYFGKQFPVNTRDIYDFMGCNYVRAINIYSKLSSDDIIKPGSDCSLGFTRPANNYLVRNIIGDTNCNLFQIGSETADDITEVHVDNIYVLGANKAGFSISTNDGGHIKDIHLNCGHTGVVHLRSKMVRTFTPFFISISNRGRIIGAEAGKYAFTENGVQRNELLIKNVNIGEVVNIILNGIDVTEVYAGSSFNGKRWKAYDGSQRRTAPIIAGYSLPNTLDFQLPNGEHTGYIKNVVVNDIHILVKGGNSAADTLRLPPELGVGQYNASNLGTLPSYGLWARHVRGLTIGNCSFLCEQPDARHKFVLDDVINLNY